MDSRYEKGKIYKITDIGYNKCYIGSTIQPLYKRFSHHRDTFEYGGCSSAVIFKEYGKDNCKIELIEDYPCSNREQLKARKGYYVEKLKCVNKFIPGGNKSNWDKRSHHKHKEARNERCRQHYETNREKILEQCKVYRENHREEKREKDKKYRENNRDKLNTQKLENILCECGCYSVRSSIARHRKSEKHISLMKQKSESS